MRPKLIVFDMDGTLVDSRRAIVTTFQDACRELDAPVPEEAEVVRRIGLPLDRMMRELTGWEDPTPLVERYRETYVAHDLAHSRLFPGVMDLMRHLTSPLAIATSKSQQGAERSSARHGLTPHMGWILGHDSVARPKPHPDMLQELMKRAGAFPDETIMVGDTRFDLEMADAAGVRGLGVSWGMHDAEALRDWPIARSMYQLSVLLSL